MIFNLGERGPRPTSRPFFHARSEKSEFGFAQRPILIKNGGGKKFKIVGIFF